MNSGGSGDEIVTQMFRRDLEITSTTSTTTEQNQGIGNENDQNTMNNPQHVRAQGRSAVSRTAGTATRSRSASSSVDRSDRIYAMAEYYRKRKEMQLKRIKEEEERQRKHVAKPMPNFKAIHVNLLAKKESLEKCVSPETPEVLRRGLAMKEKQQQKIKEYQAKLAERPQISTRPAKVLTTEAFLPKIAAHPPIKIVPFDLHMSDRLKDRKQWDQNYQTELAKKKEMEQQKLAEEEARSRQLLREQTVFKAKPNPFKKCETVSDEL